MKSPLVFLALTGATVLAAAESQPSLVQAARDGREVQVRALLADGTDANAAAADGTTALMEAAAGGHGKVARLLIRAGADVDARDRLGRTALDRAEQAGRSGMVRLLRSQGGRGSGRSVGDTVCVRKWAGAGFCGLVEAVEGVRLRLRLTTVEGCENGCGPDEQCSGSTRIVSPSGDAGRVFWVPSWCLTHTYPGSAR